MTAMMIELTQVDSRATREAERAHEGVSRNRFFTDTDEPGENGDRNPATDHSPSEVTRKVLVSPVAIRSITARRGERAPGSRLTFSDGGGYAVTETYDEIKALFVRAGVEVISLPEGQERTLALAAPGTPN